MTCPAPKEGAKHLLTALTCFLSRKQMQVHTREAIKRKALIPICNCFSISTGLLTGPKSGDTLSLQSLSPGLRAHRVSSLYPSPRGWVSPLHSATTCMTRGESLLTTARRRGDPHAPRGPLPGEGFCLALIVNKAPRDSRRKRSEGDVDGDTRLRIAQRYGGSHVSMYPLHRGFFMFFPTRSDSYAEPSYAHRAAAAIFRASTQFFRTTLARHRLSRFRTSKPIDGVSRESIRNRTS